MVQEPERFGRYILLRKLASGGMAEIFLAKLVGVEGFEKQVVLKKILSQWSADREFIAMLIDEAKIAVQLTHPNLIQVYELTREEDIYSIVMEYVAGVDVRRMMQRVHQRQMRVPIDVALLIVTEVLEGLDYAHAKRDNSGAPMNIVHRDISPQNILLSYEGAVKITDFGIAKAASRSHETMVGVLKGKFAYMSPEQANQDDLDFRSDLYATAIVLYEVLTAERLFYRGSDIETLDRVRRGQYTFSEEAKRDVPPALLAILEKSLSRHKEERYASAAAFRDDLLQFALESQLQLRREKLVRFLKNLFSEEQEKEREEETRLTTQATRLLTQEKSIKTETARQEVVLVQREDATRVIPQPLEEPGLPSSNKISFTKNQLAVAVGAGFTVVLLAVVIASFRKPEKEAKITVLPAASTSLAPTETNRPPVVSTAAPMPVAVSESLPTTLATSVTTPPPVMEVVPEPMRETKKPVVETASKKSEVEKEDKKEKSENGTLSVNADPWGYVTIDGKGRWETPVHRSLKPGKHRIQVSYEPEDKVATSVVEINSEKTIYCFANFRSGKSLLRCGN